MVASREHPLTRQNVITVDSADALSMGAAAQGVAAPRGLRTYLRRNHAAGGEHRNLLAVDDPHHAVRRGNADGAELDRGAQREWRFGFIAPLPVDVPWDGPIVGITTKRDWKPNDVQAAFLHHLKRNATAIAGESGDESMAGIADIAGIARKTQAARPQAAFLTLHGPQTRW